jgi:hypothetical protein
VLPAAGLAERGFLLGLIRRLLAPAVVLAPNGRVGLSVVECATRGFVVFVVHWIINPV